MLDNNELASKKHFTKTCQFSIDEFFLEGLFELTPSELNQLFDVEPFKSRFTTSSPSSFDYVFSLVFFSNFIFTTCIGPSSHFVGFSFNFIFPLFHYKEFTNKKIN
jgi:hypothetical protein